MQCPQCLAPLPPESSVCPGCGGDLAVALALQALQQDLQRVREHSAGVAAELDHLQERLTVFASAVHLRLHAAPVQHASGTAPAAAPPAAAPAPDETGAVPAEAEAPAAQSTLAMPGATEIRFGQKWLLIAGVIITVLGIGFFLKYAFEQNWIGPRGRILLGYLAAVGFLGAGNYFRRQTAVAAFGLYLLGGGLATLYLTTFAAFQLYQLLAQGPTFGFMVLITTFACLLALVYDTQWLAALGLIGGFLTPVILSTGHNQQMVLMSYMALLNGGILTLAFAKRWPLLNALGFLCTWLLFSGWFVSSYTAAAFWRTMVFLQLFFLTYALAPFAYYFMAVRHERVTGLVVTGLNTLIAFGYAFGMVRAYATLQAASLITLAYAGLFFALTRVLYRRHPENGEPLLLMLAKGLFFLILTVPLLCSGHWITVFWAIQGAVILWAALSLRHLWLSYGALALLALAVGKLLFYDYGEVFQLSAGLSYAGGFATRWLERWSTLIVVLGALLGSARQLRTSGDAGAPWQATTAAWVSGVFAVLVFLVLTLEVSAWFFDYAPQARFAAISVLWTLFSVGLMLIGFRQRHAVLRLVSLGLFGITVGKVFLWDMARASTPFRIVSFVVLGLVLIGASYLYYRYRDRLFPTSRPEDVC